jgi:hypothetical protein
MSTATTSSAAAASTCAAQLYNIPVSDAACAISYGGNHTDIMSECCNGADVVSYYDNCGLYCLAQGQNVGTLTDCMFKNGASYSEVFCNQQQNATATVTGSVPTSAGASVVATGTSGSASKTGDSKTSGTGTDSSASSTSSGNAAAGLRPDSAVNMMGLAIGALLFSATALGAIAI